MEIRIYLLFCFLAFLGGLRNAEAQSSTDAPAPADKNVAELTSQDEPASFKVKVNLVLVPVVVRDRQGRAVGNLNKEDFQLFDGSKAQLISKFSVEKSAGAGATVSAPKGTPAATEAPVATQAPAAGQTPGQLAPAVIPERYVAYLFDDVHLSFGELATARDAAQRHLNASLGPAARAAIYTTSGQTTLDFTNDRAGLSEALLRLRPRPDPASARGCPDISYFMADQILNVSDPQAMDIATQQAFVCLGMNPSEAKEIPSVQNQVRQAATRALTLGDDEIRRTLEVMRQVVRRVSVMPGQRSVVFVSPGFFLTSDRQHDVAQLLDTAIGSNVIVSSLDARGLYATVESAAETSGTPSIAGAPGLNLSNAHTDSPQQLRLDQMAAAQMETQAKSLQVTGQFLSSDYQRRVATAQLGVLSDVAAGTGGTFFHNSNDLDEGFRRVDNRPEYIYVLGFSPQNLKMDGRMHPLKVTLKDSKGLTLEARRGYFAPSHGADPAEEAKREIEDALFSREEMHDLPVDLQTQFFKSSEATAKLSVLAHVNVKEIRFRKADGRNRNDLTIVSGLFDSNGIYVAAVSKTVQMRFRDETLATRLGSGITVRESFDVKPGSYAVRLIVRDAEGQLMSAQNAAVQIP